jgi:hypothetical protein
MTELKPERDASELSMLYLLLIIPHLVAFVALLWFGCRSGFVDDEREDFRDGWDDGPSDAPPSAPRPGPSYGGPPLPDASPPRRRVRVGERLAELYPRRPRREVEPVGPAPERTPSRSDRPGF